MMQHWSDFFHHALEAGLTSEQWQALVNHLSKPLDDAGKAKILDFLDFRMLHYRLENTKAFKTLTAATLYREIVAFKKTVQALIPQAEIEALKKHIHLLTRLSNETENTLQEKFAELSIHAKTFINNELYLMTRTDTAKHIYHPSQYDIAAKLALEKIPQPKQHQGRGNIFSAEKQHLYTCVFTLWRNLGETNFAIWHNTSNNESSQLVAFTHALLKAEFECIKQHDPKTLFKLLKEQAISKNMKEFEKLIPYFLEN